MTQNELNPAYPANLLSRIEDAGINASAPPQQLWIDGWLVRFSPGKAKRARCIQAVADGRLPLDERLALCADLFRTVGLPMVLRQTPFSRPLRLAEALAAKGWSPVDDTRVMVLSQITKAPEPVPAGLQLVTLDAADFAEAVGHLRGSPGGQRAAHAERLQLSPVPCSPWALRRRDDGVIVACAQSTAEADLVGLYDVFTAESARGQGLARILCTQLLANARAAGSRVAYLQVDADNHPARAIYNRLGFADAYAYSYATPPLTA